MKRVWPRTLVHFAQTYSYKEAFHGRKGYDHIHWYISTALQKIEGKVAYTGDWELPRTLVMRGRCALVQPFRALLFHLNFISGYPELYLNICQVDESFALHHVNNLLLKHVFCIRYGYIMVPTSDCYNHLSTFFYSGYVILSD